MSTPITCHCLNTVSGTPADNLKATLTLLSSDKANSKPTAEPITFSAVTNEDGRVKEWGSSNDGNHSTLSDLVETFENGAKVAWSIRFDIGPWYEARGVESFWPEVEVKFFVKKGERHYHVPVLVGPWSYTTYRGS